MKGIIGILIVLLGLLQYKLWVGDGSLSELWYRKQKISAQEMNNTALRQRNQQLEAEVRDLKEGLDAAEERAREELGMVKRGEVFYLVVEE
ncbi:MAG: cell division protein FtsB [Gammaproteobacteria bacterium]|nr:cell division protein FtsB [Gammaproteobacteria bacterium]MDJ0889684.1 cell division protein FtsB [Gammaproteobacteria bacterium]